MIPREYLSLVLSIWLSLTAGLNPASAERWSRQVSNSEWIPLANPRSSLPQSASLNQVPVLPELNLPPQLRQEYQQQILQLQKTQESIQKLLLLQQQLKSQQQLLQNQAYLPNAVGPDDERQSFPQTPVSHHHNNVPERNQDALTPPQILSETVPPVYSPQEFRQSHRDENYENERPQESRQEEPTGPSNNGEKTEDDEEIQVVYVPAETLAQRGQSKEERNRDHKHFTFPHERQQSQRYQAQEVSSPDDASYNNQDSTKYSRGRDESDFLKAARERELERLNEQRREIQKQAKLQAAAMQREQERMRQRETEKKRKELAKLEEAAKQRELERIRETRERQRLQDAEREKERAAKARQAEIDRLAAVERQKKLELEKLARKEEERLKALAERREKETSESVQQEYVGHHHQHLTETGKQKPQRARAKNRPRLHHHKTADEHLERSHEISTSAPTPNQPPLAVYMGSDFQTGEAKIIDILRILRNAKTIAVVDQLTPDAPKVFVGPSNLETPSGYAKFDLPYLSSLDTNRVERRVDKLPFFVAPLSFNPPPGYSKIPFPAPHIGSVIVNTIENTGPVSDIQKPNPQPLIEPNSFISSSNQESTYQPSYQSPTTPAYSTYTQEHVNQQYHSTPNFAPSSTESVRYRQQPQQQQYQSNVHHLNNQETISLSPYEEEVITPPSVPARPHRPDYPEEDLSDRVTPGITYRKPTVVSSYSYEQDPLSTTPTYQDSYVHTRVQPNRDQDLTSQLAQINQHDYSQHRHVENPYQHPVQQSGISSHHGNHYNSELINSHIPTSYDDQRGTLSPSQYNLPAELPPIHPQLPGLINSLVDNKEERTVLTTTSTTPVPTTTTTQAAITHRTRSKQRSRVTSHPITTTTTATSSRESSRTSEKHRRPFNRSRSRYTTTTEEYKETYEPTRGRAPETTTKGSSNESYRRPGVAKSQKIKSRTSERPYESSTANQIHNIQSHETVADEANPPVDIYSQQNSPISNENQGNYGHYENSEDPVNSYNSEIDYSKTQNYPHPVSIHREQRPLIDDSGIPQQHYQNRNQAPGVGYQASLIEQNEQYNYPIHNDGEKSGLRLSSSPNDYYYTEKNDGVEPPGRQEENPTESPIYTQILEYRPGGNPESGQQGQLSNEYSQTSQYSGEKSISGSIEDGDVYSHYSSQEPIEQTTQPIQTTTTEIPTVIRQRVRGRLSSRTRQDSAIQTNPRGSQDDFVQFSVVNKPAETRGSSGRQRESNRTRSKSRPKYQNQAQVQSEGNEYVRIQSSNRQNHPKTIVQAAARVTTTTAPSILTTTEELPGNDDDYGFIRPPNFNQSPQNQISSKFRAPESQIQLQNIAPTDETAEDSSPTLTQIPKHRQKYQSPNRPRPDIKSTASPPSITTTPSLDGFTNKPRIRNEEPKNRIRNRARRPGSRKRPATTTTTTTEYVLDGNNNLPLDENYPRIPISRTESSVERQHVYDSSYEALPHAPPEVATSRVDYSGENYPPEFLINFNGNSGTEEQQDQSQTASAPRRQMHRHSSAAGRLRSYSHQPIAPERDIYGAESQWSTKLSKSSFQPSSNQLSRDDNKTISSEELEASEKAPEIITAQPEQAFVTVLVSSDDKLNDTKEEVNSGEASMESTDFGQKTSSEVTTNSSGIADDEAQILQRKSGGRRRRVRVRIRPATSREDFVTSESQHINSAVNNLVQGQTKHNRPMEVPRFMFTTQETTEIPTTTVPTETLNANESIQSTDITTINYTEGPWDTNSSDVLTTQVPINNDENVGITDRNELTTIAEKSEEFETTVSDDLTDAPLMTTMTVPRKSWDSTKGYADWFIKKQANFFASNLEDQNASDEDSQSFEDSGSHPKNHRSEWSEVRYLDDKNTFGYGKSNTISPTTQLPGLVTKAVGDSSVKTLSDYVQAIFDTMKNVEGERSISDNAPDLWKDEAKPSSSTEVYNFPTDLSTIMGFPKSEAEQSEENKGAIESNKEKNEIDEKVTTVPVESDKPEKIGTTVQPSSISEMPTTIASSIRTSITSEVSPKNSTSTSESAPAVQTKLGAILRTSTTTKVSHMTEICYRGRCVMTKPRKDLSEGR